MLSTLNAALLHAMLLAAALATRASTTNYGPSAIKPPLPLREFRGVWVATVGNIDWPSKAGLTTQQQKAELIAILDGAVHLRLNAIIFQVRPGCDALYASSLEPWSEYLTGQMGRAPAPFYDPLAFAVQEAHQRGLELHAWFNPFRAHHLKARSPVAPDHISKTHPEWVKRYGPQLWLDPGEEGVRAYSRLVILDVVKRYDVDGIHLDDYFYPYPEKDGRGQTLPFPDGTSWTGYLTAGGKLPREEWRRGNVDHFIQQLYKAIKSERPFVKFGVSPFGIWRPGFPQQIKGFDPYAALFADSRKWFAEGWLDYFTPQLYWSNEPKEQSYSALLNWWSEQNLQHRHLWAGDAPGRIGPKRAAAEIVNQIRLTRRQAGASGNIHWSMSALMQNRGGIGEALLTEVYTQQALIPASTWLAATPPSAPRVTVEKDGSEGAKIHWRQTGAEAAAWWVLQMRTAGEWTTEILPGHQLSHLLKPTSKTEAIALTAIERSGNAGVATVLEQLPTAK